MNKKSIFKEENKQDNSIKLSIIWASFLLGVFSIIGTAWGELGLRTMFIILSVIGALFFVSAVSK